ncbi:MAG TPA: hypothetical protein VGE99_12075 [Candidatus Dormibacteraeota bacterium]
MRGFFFGLVVLVAVGVTVLSLRPGGIRKQLRFAARRLRIVLILGGIYVAGSTIVRFAAPEGALADYGPPGLAIVLAAVFIVVGRDPTEPSTAGSTGPSRKS